LGAQAVLQARNRLFLDVVAPAEIMNQHPLAGPGFACQPVEAYIERACFRKCRQTAVKQLAFLWFFATTHLVSACTAWYT